MGRTLPSHDAREERLELFHQRQLASLMRKDASEKKVNEALGLAQDIGLPRLSVEFRLDDAGDYAAGRWLVPSGLGVAFENYVFLLCEMEKVRFENSAVGGLTSRHTEAFDAVVAAADVLAKLGWPVNWQQNVQTILEVTEYGLRDGKLVDRFAALPECVTLGEELLLLGTVTFLRQNRSADGAAAPFRSAVLSAENRSLYESTPLYLRGDNEELPARFRYSSRWLLGTSGTSYRIAV